MKLISSKEAYQCKLFTVSEEVARDPDGFEIARSIVHHPGSAEQLCHLGHQILRLGAPDRCFGDQDGVEIPLGIALEGRLSEVFDLQRSRPPLYHGLIGMLEPTKKGQ